jgi:putative membrane fusion protein
MKPGTLIVKIVMWVFFLGALAYFGVYAYHVLFSGYETVQLYNYSAEETVEATGYMVREEQPLEGASDFQEVVVAEGETVAVKDTLAVIYDNQEALDRHLEIQNLEAHLESLQYILSHSSDDSDSGLNSDIFDSIIEMRTCTSSGDLTSLEDTASQLRTLMFRRDYTYNGSSALTEEISQQVEKVEKLAEQNRAFTAAISASCSGVFSSMVDGYERVLTPDAIKDLTPARLRDLLDKREEVEDEEGYLGKIITGATWYFAALLDEESSQLLKIGDKVTLRFNSMARTIQMKVDSISRADDGTVCVVFSTDKYLAETTLLRDQTVDIIFDTITGYRVEKSAVHVENETGEVGVYRVYGAQATWVPIEILWEDEDSYLIRQATVYDEDGNPVETTQLEDAKQLRSGAEIIVKGTKLYDGKVIK